MKNWITCLLVSVIAASIAVIAGQNWTTKAKEATELLPPFTSAVLLHCERDPTLLIIRVKNIDGFGGVAKDTSCSTAIENILAAHYQIQSATIDNAFNYTFAK